MKTAPIARKDPLREKICYYVDDGNIPEEDSQAEAGMSPEEQVDAMMSASADDDDLGSLEATPPIEQALMGEDGEFWEDFDDDPDAANKPLVEEDEEEGYDENEENSDLLSMMTPDAGEGEGSLENGLSEDEGDFDFSDFDDAAVESAPAAAEETAQADGNAAEPEADAEPEPVKPVNVPSSFEPEFDDEAPVKSVPLEAEPVAAPISTPEAQQMMNDLKQQQKELELQQRELALQQKEFADALKQENEKMIHETVEKAVEEKFSEYDLQPEPVIEEAAAEEEEAVVEEEPVVEEEAAVEEPVIEEPVFEEPVFEEPAAEPEVSVEDQYIVEDEYLDGDFALTTEDLVSEEPEAAVEEPELVLAEPEVAVEEPVVEEIKFEEPELILTEPEVTAEEPVVEEIKFEEPELVLTEPEVTAEEPAVEEFKAEEPELSVEDLYLNVPETEIPEPAAVEEPVIEAISFEEPAAVVEEPVVEAPVLEGLMVEEPEAVIEEPVIEEPVVEVSAPVIEEPVAAEPAVEEPVVAEPAVEEPAKPKSIDDFLAEILREGAAEEPVHTEPAFSFAAPAEETPAVPEPEAAPEPSVDSILEDLYLTGPGATAEPAFTAPEPVIEEAKVDEPAVVVEEPAVVDEPVAVVEEPAAVVDEPAVVVDESEVEAPQLIIDEPSIDELVINAPATPEPAPEAEEAPTLIIDAPELTVEAPEEAPKKESDALSIEELEQDLFGAVASPSAEVEATKKIDKFYTLYRKNEEFQRLLDEEYNKLKAAGGTAPEPAVPETAPEVKAEAAAPAPAEVKVKKVEDATIYQDFDLEKEAARLRAEQEAAENSADAGKVALGAAAVGAAAVAAEKIPAAGSGKTTDDTQIEYEEVDKGGGCLTVLAVIIAILLIVLLGVILVLNFMPDSSIALRIDSIIENITSHFTAVDVLGRQLLL